jgi:hypothetical protein
VAFVVIAIIASFGWRWRSLLREALPLSRSLLLSAFGLAGNQVLPFRGGDALRAALSTRGPGAPSIHAVVPAMAMEKLFDLVALAAFGLASASYLAAGRNPTAGMNVFAAAAAILMLSAAFLLASRSGLLMRSLRAAARLLRMPPRLYRHAFEPLHHLRRSASPERLALLLFQTSIMWLVLYTAAYLSIASLVGVSLAIPEAMVLLFAGALGVAIPAAPSGLGTFHAAIVSGFLVLDRSPAEGLVLAVAIHGVFFVGICAAGAVALAIGSRRFGPIR